MDYSIGGEFSLSPEIFAQEGKGPNIQPYPHNYQVLVDTGRSALFLALSGIIQQGGKKAAWLPRYCCDSVVLPFQQLGFKVHYYSMGHDLQSPDLLPQDLDGETLLFINYFGKKNQALIKWLERQSRTFFIIEDNVQASLSTHLGRSGHYVINSYRKFLPQPDGALLAYDKPIDWEIDPPDEEFISSKLIGKLIKAVHGNPAHFLNLLAQSELWIDRQIKPHKISFLSQYLLARTDFEEISAVRRSNWSYLQRLLKSQPAVDEFISPLYDVLEDGEVPLGLPVKISPRCRDGLRNFLMKNNIYCPVHWKLNSDLTETAFAADYELSRSILTLPVDQRLNHASLDYLFTKMTDYFRLVFPAANLLKG